MTASALLQGQPREDSYEDNVLESLRPRLEAIVARLTESGTPLPDPAELAAAMAAAVPDTPTRSEYDKLLGPFYSSAGVMRLLRIPSKQALDDRRKRGTLLAARTSDGVWVYPAFQFDAQARIVRGPLKPVLSALKTAPRWGAALWLISAHDELNGKTPLEAADDPGQHQLVCRLAARYAEGMAA